MKKRLLLPFTLCFAISLALQGCGSSSRCTIHVFPTGTNGQVFYALIYWQCDGYRQQCRVGFGGDVFVPKRCSPDCSGIYVLDTFFSFTFAPSPSAIDLLSPPSSITFSGGGGIDTSYGLPQV